MKEKKPKVQFYPKAEYHLNKNFPRELLYDMADDYDMTREDVDMFLKQHEYGAAMKNAVREGGKEIFERLDMMFIEDHPNIVIYLRGENVEFYEYGSGFYSPLSGVNMYNLVDAFMVKNNLLTERSSSRRVADTIRRIQASLATVPEKVFSDEKVNMQSWRLNLENGLYNPSSGILEPHVSSYFSTGQVPFPYDPDARCPEFESFLSMVSMSDTQTVGMIQEMFGYCLQDGNPKHKIFYLYGETGRNGKSTTARLLSGLIGRKNVSVLSLSQLANDNSALLTSLVGAQLNFSDEVSSKYIDSPRLTSMSAEGSILINPKYKQAFTYDIRAKFVIACNDLPRFADAQGISVRIIPILFPYQIPQDKRIERYEDYLLAKEGSGILNWAMEGARRLLKQKHFTMADVSEVAAHENKLQANPPYQFLEDTYDFSPSFPDPVYLVDMYGEREWHDDRATGFRRFCLDMGIGTLSQQKFGNEVRRFCKETGKMRHQKDSKGVYYTGLKKKELW